MSRFAGLSTYLRSSAHMPGLALALAAFLTNFDVTAVVKPGAANQISILTTRTFFNELGTGGLLGPAALYREK